MEEKLKELEIQLSESAKRMKEYKDTGAYDQEAYEQSIYMRLIEEIFNLNEKMEKIASLEKKLKESAKRMKEYKDTGAYDQEAYEHSIYMKLVEEISKLKEGHDKEEKKDDSSKSKEEMEKLEKIASLEKKLKESAKRMKEYKDTGAYDQEAYEHSVYMKLIEEISKLKDDESKKTGDDEPKKSKDDESKKTGDDEPKKSKDDEPKKTGDDESKKIAFPKLDLNINKKTGEVILTEIKKDTDERPTYTTYMDAYDYERKSLKAFKRTVIYNENISEEDEKYLNNIDPTIYEAYFNWDKLHDGEYNKQAATMYVEAVIQREKDLENGLRFDEVSNVDMPGEIKVDIGWHLNQKNSRPKGKEEPRKFRKLRDLLTSHRANRILKHHDKPVFLNGKKMDLARVKDNRKLISGFIALVGTVLTISKGCSEEQKQLPQESTSITLDAQSKKISDNKFKIENIDDLLKNDEYPNNINELLPKSPNKSDIDRGGR